MGLGQVQSPKIIPDQQELGSFLPQLCYSGVWRGRQSNVTCLVPVDITEYPNHKSQLTGSGVD